MGISVLSVAALHVDFAGLLLGKMYLVLVDAYSKWPEIVEMNSTMAEETIGQIRTLLARMGVPQQLVSDNSPQFTSKTFRRFMKANGKWNQTCDRSTVSPFHKIRKED